MRGYLGRLYRSEERSHRLGDFSAELNLRLALRRLPGQRRPEQSHRKSAERCPADSEHTAVNWWPPAEVSEMAGHIFARSADLLQLCDQAWSGLAYRPSSNDSHLLYALFWFSSWASFLQSTYVFSSMETEQDARWSRL